MIRYKLLWYFLMGVSLAMLLLYCVLWWQKYQHMTTITFLNVGSGDAILISQGMNQVLIDSGRNGNDVLAQLGRQIPFWDRTIEVLIATHPDADHIGGFASVIEAYSIPFFLFTGSESDTETSLLLQQMLEKYHVQKKKVFRGTTIRFPVGGELVVEYPLTELPAIIPETNMGSIVSRFVFRETDILLTGDLAREETVLPDIASADILKIAHHGSKYSTSDIFLERVRPYEAIISVGKNNYGHPSPDVIERLIRHNILIRRTDLMGSIRYRCTEAIGGCVIDE
ncbi:MAG: ComEC/Rec2 family competence protein [Minisyncoccota bacterium]